MPTASIVPGPLSAAPRASHTIRFAEPSEGRSLGIWRLRGGRGDQHQSHYLAQAATQTNTEGVSS